MCIAGNRQVRRKRHIAAVPLMTDASTSVRTMPARRAKFPPLRFISEGVRTAVRPHFTRSCVSRNVQLPSGDSHTCLRSGSDENVAETNLCSEHVEQQVQPETASDLHSLTVQHWTSNAVAVSSIQHPAATGCLNSCSDTLTSRQCLRSSRSKVVDDPADCNHTPGGRTLCSTGKNLTVAEKSHYSPASQEQDLIARAWSTSAVNFDINTPMGEVEPSSICSDDRRKVVNEVESEADENSIEPVRVLCFSHIDKSLDETYDPAEHAICAAELNEHVSELIDGEGETSRNNHLNSHPSMYHNVPKVFSMLNALTPFENHSENAVLVSDTPVSDYELSYRQRALKAANIRLRHRTHKS